MRHVRPRRGGFVAALTLTAACTGQVAMAPGGQPAPIPEATTPPRQAPPPATMPTAKPEAPPGACTTRGAVVPGPLVLRRLTNGEYERSVRDLLGRSGLPAVTGDFPSDPDVNGSSNDAAALGLGATHAEKYRDTAERLSWEAISSEAKRNAVVGCIPVGGERGACLRGFVTRMGRRVFRRPLTESEIGAFTSLADIAASDANPYMGAALVLQAMLQSPHFLFRVEVGVPDATQPGRRRLTGFEVATRLSYLLLRTTPSDALLDAAATGVLDTREGLAEKAKELLTVTSARDGVRAFLSDWLRLRQLDSVTPEPHAYPKFDEGVRSSLRDEAVAFAEDVLWNGSALDLLTARHSFLNPTLETLYGVKVANRPANPSAQKVQVKYEFTDQPRAGLLTQGALLTANGREEGVAPILRGKFVREALLCQPSLPVPDNVPPLPEQKGTETVRARLQSHRSNPACAPCHDLLDPVGFGLEQFDLVGRYRTVDANGNALTGQGSVAGLASPDFTGPVALGQKLRQSAEFSGCVVTHMFRYAYGRAEGSEDACAIKNITQAFVASDHQFREMVLALVASDGFRYGTAEVTP